MKKDIDVDLKKRGQPISNPTHVDDVLFFYTNHLGYQYHVKAGVPRVDLEGNAGAKVTEAEQREAEHKIIEIRAEMMERQQRQRQNDGDLELVLPPDEQTLFNKIESLATKARALRLDDDDFELTIKALELLRQAAEKLISKYSKEQSE